MNESIEIYDRAKEAKGGMNRATKRWLQHLARKAGDLGRKKTHRMRSKMHMKEGSNGANKT
jgi:hypothetical protein